MLNLKEVISDALDPVVELIAREAARVAFNEFIEANPENGKLTLATLYPVVDVKLEKVVKGTKTTLDDAFVKGFKEGMESVAETHGIILSNLDDD